MLFLRCYLLLAWLQVCQIVDLKVPHNIILFLQYACLHDSIIALHKYIQVIKSAILLFSHFWKCATTLKDHRRFIMIPCQCLINSNEAGFSVVHISKLCPWDFTNGL